MVQRDCYAQRPSPYNDTKWLTPVPGSNEPQAMQKCAFPPLAPLVIAAAERVSYRPFLFVF